ncbi:MAG: 5'-methylthioadenosine/S-adenosylhomocysteine nucleosidase [Leptolinea sp.]|nr:5'-methylthioadenosine/S-adenosylhomocysteine nucleosidase [Leptolinea sp.]
MDSQRPVVVLVSADAEWFAVKEYYPDSAVYLNPFGEFFLRMVEKQSVVFMHGGWGKISAAASAGYAITQWDPELVINLGTCGGLQGQIERHVIFMPDRTLTYDIFEQMGNQQQSIEFYTTTLDHSWLKKPLPLSVESGLLVSGDRDIVPADIPSLIQNFHARAADWESASIAWVTARKFGRYCLILRGVSDLVSEQGGEAYNGMSFFENSSRQIMRRLCDSLPAWLACAGY